MGVLCLIWGVLLFVTEIFIMIFGHIPGTPISHYKPAVYVEWQDELSNIGSLSDDE